MSSVWGRIVGLGLRKSVGVGCLWSSHVGSYAEVERERDRKRGREKEREGRGERKREGKGRERARTHTHSACERARERERKGGSETGTVGSQAKTEGERARERECKSERECARESKRVKSKDRQRVLVCERKKLATSAGTPQTLWHTSSAGCVLCGG